MAGDDSRLLRAPKTGACEIVTRGNIAIRVDRSTLIGVVRGKRVDTSFRPAYVCTTLNRFTRFEAPAKKCLYMEVKQ